MIGPSQRMTPEDYDRYNDQLRRSLEDKLFFLPMIPEVDAFGDYGCGDGSVLEMAARYAARRWSHQSRLPFLIGADQDQEQRRRASQRLGTLHDRWLIASGWPVDVAAHHRKCLILSSVLHEMAGTLDDVIHTVIDPIDPEVIVIREMARSRAEDRAEAFLEVALKAPYRNQPQDWERERRETYLKFPMEDYLDWANMWGYRVTYLEHSTPPWFREFCLKEYGIRPPCPTHMKLILEKNR